MYTLADPEISVATTKVYSCRIVCADILVLEFARVQTILDMDSMEYELSEFISVPEKIQKVLYDKERLQWFAAKFANAKEMFFISHGIDYAIRLEGTLKMKEIIYVHSEAYATGDLKHGTISLIEDGTLVISVLPQSDLYEKNISNMVWCKNRGTYLMDVTEYVKYDVEDQVNFTAYVPREDEYFAGSLALISLQL